MVSVPRALKPGTRLGKYTLVRRLARGGMAEVYLGHERGPAGVERLVALKLVLPQYAEEPHFLKMFINEARIITRLDHPNVAQLFEVGDFDSEPFIAMEYVHGKTVRDVLIEATEQEAPTSPAIALAIVVAACDALHFAHERKDIDGRPLGIVHRDVSPSNIMVRFDGVVKVLDFGIAKAATQTTATASDMLKGKSGYMSPEQCRGATLDRRSDVFNLGILLYETSTRRRAFVGDNPAAVMRRVLETEYVAPCEMRPELPQELERIIARSLSGQPEDRYPSAAALAEDLRALAVAEAWDLSAARLCELMSLLFGDQPYPETDVAPLPSITRTRPRPRRGLALLAGGTLILGAAAGGWFLRGTEKQQAPAPPRKPEAVVEAPPTPAPRPDPDPPTRADPPVPPAPVEPAAPEVAPEPKKSKSKSKPKSKPRPKPKSKPKSKRDGPSGMYPP